MKPQPADVQLEQEYHVSSLVVLTQPPLRHRLAEQIGALEGAEVHVVSEEGKLVVTLEGPSQRPIMAAIDAINAMPGVLSAGLIYHQFDERDVQCKE
ncbi:nitrate reductase NapD [Aeromonas sp. BIGb0405]|jgi:periplasmic nitrate reductase NapD|uniref:chaperone NapD n=1 Tax=Aeromonas TaxID=642 RepID=UPI002166FDC7|nr:MULTISPECIES: chaperone NapD [Aeromonas]MCS3455494.1 nitrate reductase NapD [Aeromonas sp. BIGb0405]MCS3458464.1 nitrate reductase NapD [Aeromonas sp. BIGb0445]UBO72798.1 chaperone NapD [Aeromonas rivuli]